MTNNFTMDVIHEMRDENYEKTKQMTHEQLLEHTQKEALEGLEILGKLRSTQNPA